MPKTAPTVQQTAIPTAGLQRLLEIMSCFRAIDPEFPLQYTICLCEIAQAPGLSLTTLAEKTGLSLSTISRIVGALSDYRPNGAPYGLVRMEVAKEERRRRELHLTDAGIALLQKAIAPLEGGNTAKSLRTAW
jgi:DNA-binding MarR family transcriptional regulator